MKKVLTTGAGFLQILAPGDWVCHYEKPKGGQGRAKIGSRTERHRVQVSKRKCCKIYLRSTFFSSNFS